VDGNVDGGHLLRPDWPGVYDVDWDCVTKSTI
jgi:hypothetical protein